MLDHITINTTESESAADTTDQSTTNRAPDQRPDLLSPETVEAPRSPRRHSRRSSGASSPASRSRSNSRASAGASADGSKSPITKRNRSVRKKRRPKSAEFISKAEDDEIDREMNSALTARDETAEMEDMRMQFQGITTDPAGTTGTASADGPSGSQNADAQSRYMSPTPSED